MLTNDVRAQGRAKNEVKTCGEQALLIASTYYWHTNRHDKGRDLLDKLFKINPASQPYAVYCDSSVLLAPWQSFILFLEFVKILHLI